MNHSALFIFGLQNDFSSLGNASVEGFENISDKIEAISSLWTNLVAINESHPADHVSFAACHPWRKPTQVIKIGNISQYLWPIHCVTGTMGVFNPPWLKNKNPFIIEKGNVREIDIFSAFDVSNLASPALPEYLKNHHITHLYFSGFPLEYEIKETCIDALRLAYKVTLITDCILSLDLNKQQGIYDELLALGANIIPYPV
jgi:nicotinamidase/pyrazinamidase